MMVREKRTFLLPLLPLPHEIVSPSSQAHLRLHKASSKNAVAQALATKQKWLVLAAPQQNFQGQQFGTLACILDVQQNPKDDEVGCRVRGLERVLIEERERRGSGWLAKVAVVEVGEQRLSSYLEFISALPWNKTTDELFDHKWAEEQLDATHAGLSDVKEQLLEYMSISRLNPTRRAPILALVGPPGVGKVSLAAVVARCLKRPLEHINLAALQHEKMLMGENRHQTYGGPGKIMQAIHRSGVSDPVIILEELDHISWDGSDRSGLPLIEILDPRNTNFVDAYVDIPFDLSKVWFIVTANSLDGVPRVLRDHLEVIEIPGYTDREKIKIAEDFLLPCCLQQAGLSRERFLVQSPAILKIIRRYTRETGVRQLQRCIERMVRKAARQLETQEVKSIAVRGEDLGDYLGPEWFFEEEARQTLPPGVATGLVWTEGGGEVMYVEAVHLPKGHGLILTGRLGKIMRESAETALSYLWSHASELKISQEDFLKMATHIHVPAASISKDGPSAGITILVALASLFLKIPVRSDVAMTGEITLTGQVFPVGAIREKALAAHRAGFSTFLVPQENGSDLKVLPQEIRDHMQFILIDKVEDVFGVVFPELNVRKKSSKRTVGLKKLVEADRKPAAALSVDRPGVV